jgi:hypothetical protein
MPLLLRRPQQTVLSGLGVAGAVLAAVVVTFTVASGLVAYSLTSDDPLAASSDALVLDQSRTAIAAARPLVLQATESRAARGRSSATAVAVAGAAANARGAAGSLSATHGGGRAGAADTVDSTQATATGPGGQPAPPGEASRTPVGGALDDTTQAVGATTASLARRLEDVTATIETHTQPIVDLTRAALSATLARLAQPRPAG